MSYKKENAAGLEKYLPGLSQKQWNQIRDGAKIEVCKEQREGWSGELPFYIFWCEDCATFSYDYPHGREHRRYLTCNHCSQSIDFRPWWVELVELSQVVKFWLSVSFLPSKDGSKGEKR